MDDIVSDMRKCANWADKGDHTSGWRIDDWADQLASLRSERDALKAERDELQQVFDLGWDAEQRAIKMWQAAGEGRECTWPDGAKLTAWLLEQNSAMTAERDALMSGAQPTCAVTGLIAGDADACGDCDPCIMGAHRVAGPIKKLLAEKEAWRSKYSDAAVERDALREALKPFAAIADEIERVAKDCNIDTDGVASRAPYDACANARSLLSPRKEE